MTEYIDMGANLVKIKHGLAHVEVPEDRNAECHFFVSSVFSWARGYDLVDCLRRAKSSDRGMEVKEYYMYLVPGKDSGYDINFYQPQVEGTIYLGTQPAKSIKV